MAGLVRPELDVVEPGVLGVLDGVVDLIDKQQAAPRSAAATRGHRPARACGVIGLPIGPFNGGTSGSIRAHISSDNTTERVIGPQSDQGSDPLNL